MTAAEADPTGSMGAMGAGDARAPIEHVIVLALENRSFDHMLGFLDHPDPDFDGLRRGGPYTNPGWLGGTVEATPQAGRQVRIDPDHSHDAVMEQLAVRGSGGARRATNQGFVRSLERKGRGLSKRRFDGLLSPLAEWLDRLTSSKARAGLGPGAMLCQPPARVPVLAKLALEFCVCTRWFCSVPGETWPNRNFLHAATSDGEVGNEIRWFHNDTIFERLEQSAQLGDRKPWHIYHDDIPQAWAFKNLWDSPRRHANWFHLSEFERHVEKGTLPAYSFLEPNHWPRRPAVSVSGLFDTESNSQHPGNNVSEDGAGPAASDVVSDAASDFASDFARGEALIATVYEALRGNPEVFKRSLLLITYDEHGGFFDHRPPPSCPAAEGQDPSTLPWTTRLRHALLRREPESFDFSLLGPRVPAVIVSPYIRRHTVDREEHEHASVPATLRALFAPDTDHLTPRAEKARPFHTVRNLEEARAADLPDLKAYVRSLARSRSRPERFDDRQEVPEHAKDFVAQAQLVAAELTRTRGVRAPMPTDPFAITRAFETTADHHREDLGEG
ncbi:alkaline phosphatase family protein [Streptomyces sp. NPDC051907]|uniref:alkaline phosphatase family protein n=1 Tax=Streptomyces sp. NPDC051907 TaxID=3155284 RepID=UPI00341B20F1